MMNTLWSSLTSLLPSPKRVVSPWKILSLAFGAIPALAAALDKRGRGLVVWENAGQIWSAQLDSANNCALASFPVADGHLPALALHEGGRGMLVWQTGEREYQGIQATPLTRGGRVEAATHALDASGSIQHLQVAVDRRGGAIVMWSQQGPEGWELRVQTYDGRTSTWQASSTRLGSPERTAFQPRLIMNSAGLAMAIWHSSGAENDGLVVAYNWPHESIWSDRPLQIAPCNATELVATLDHRGSALVCWIQRAHGQQPVLEASSFSESTCEWTSPARLATAPGLSHLRLATDAAGDTVLAWRQKESAGKEQILGRSFQDGSWVEDLMRLHAGPSTVGDYTLLKTPEQATLLCLPLGGGASIRRMEGGWGYPEALAPESEAGSEALLLQHGQGLRALWLSGQQTQVRLMLAVR